MNLFQGLFGGKCMNNIDVHLQTFYNKVLEEELNSADPINAVKVKKALREVIWAYKKDTVDSLTSSILFDSVEKRYAYVLKHCPCFTSAVWRHFHGLLRLNMCVLNDAIQRRQLNLCCLGGGPASDAVAVAKIVNALNNLNGYSEALLFKVYVVDLCADWDATAIKVMQTLQASPEFCSKNMKVRFRFLQADLTAEWPESVRSALAAADIVTMVYFVSAVNGSKDKGKCHSMLQNIMKILKPGGLLFFLDSAKDLHYRTIRAAADPLIDLHSIYGPHLDEFHTLSMKSIKKFMQLYSLQFNVRMCLTNCFVSCSAWTKVAIPIHGTLLTGPRQKILDPSSEKGPNALRKMVVYNTKLQENFRQKIEQYFASRPEFDLNGAAEDAEDFVEECFERDCWFGDERVMYPTKSKRYRFVARPDSEPFRLVDKRCEKAADIKIRSKLKFVSEHLGDPEDYGETGLRDCDETLPFPSKMKRKKNSKWLDADALGFR